MCTTGFVPDAMEMVSVTLANSGALKQASRCRPDPGSLSGVEATRASRSEATGNGSHVGAGRMGAHPTSPHRLRRQRFPDCKAARPASPVFAAQTLQVSASRIVGKLGRTQCTCSRTAISGTTFGSHEAGCPDDRHFLEPVWPASRMSSPPASLRITSVAPSWISRREVEAGVAFALFPWRTQDLH